MDEDEGVSIREIRKNKIKTATRGLDICRHRNQFHQNI